jgi:hypothetical protein
MFHDTHLTDSTIEALRVRYELARERLVGCKLRDFDELSDEERKLYFPKLLNDEALPFRL